MASKKFENILENSDTNESNSRINIEKGLSDSQVLERKEKGLVNITKNNNIKTNKEIISENIFTIFNLLNVLIAIALIIAGSFKNLLFMPIIIANTIIGIIQELKAKKTIEELSLVEAPLVSVLRNGKIVKIPSEEVVLDDICYYQAGEQIVADAIVKKGQIEANESLLTGESDNIVKKQNALLYSGSAVVSGECFCKVERVGKDNYINQLASSVKKLSKPKSEILNALNLLITLLTITVVVLGSALFINNYLVATNKDWRLSIIYTAGSMIGMIPSGLYLMTSVSLAAGVLRIAKHRTLCQELYCIEMLARVDTLCLDKTGTLTDGTMKVKEVIELDKSIDIKDVISNILGNVNGNNATFVALDKRFGHSKTYDAKLIIPFSSTRKYMAYYNDSTNESFIIGAPEFVMKKGYSGSNIEKMVDKYAKLGFRVLLVASSKEKPVGETYFFNTIKSIGLVVIEDVIRRSATETIKYFKDSNVDIKIISGDNPLTVSKIAERVGVNNANKYVSLSGLSDEEVIEAVKKYTVFGRVNPKQKQLIIKTLKEKGKTVAMTGDGVNDILALKEADCSIAMANGSSAARNISQLVLLDSNFASMPSVVLEGRRVINNIKRVATMYLTKTLFSIMLTIVCLLSKEVYPIQTVQLTLMDWFIVTIPSLYLALEPNNTQIKGKFLKDILLDALPGALLIVFNYLFIICMTNFYIKGLSHEVISSITVLSINAVGFMVLQRACKPFNNMRFVVYCVMLLLWIISYIVVGNVFELYSFNKLGITATLLLIVIVLYSIELYKGIFKFKNFLKEVKWPKIFKQS